MARDSREDPSHIVAPFWEARHVVSPGVPTFLVPADITMGRLAASLQVAHAKADADPTDTHWQEVYAILLAEWNRVWGTVK